MSYKKTPVVKFTADASQPPAALAYTPLAVLNEAAQSISYAAQRLVLCTSARVQIYSNKTLTLSKAFSRFKAFTSAACIRHDGKLMVVGDASGQIQILDMASRAILRSFGGHEGGILSASDDGSVRMWDVTTGNQTALFRHKDKVRSAQALGTIVVSGSYDHTIRVWDLKNKNVKDESDQDGMDVDGGSNDSNPGKIDNLVREMNHGAPVEKVIFLKGGAMVCSAGGNRIRMWDIRTGQMIYSMAPHSKTITDLALDSTNTYLFTASLDRQVKMIHLESYKNESTHIAVCMTNGQIAIRHRVETAPVQKKPLEILGGTHAYFTRGLAAPMDIDSNKVGSQKKQKLQPYDRHLKNFEYGRALDAALETLNPIIIHSLIAELIHRSSLHVALRDRDESRLLPLLTHCHKYILDARFSAEVAAAMGAVVDSYGAVLCECWELGDIVGKIRDKIKMEAGVVRVFNSSLGMLESFYEMEAAVGR